MAKEDLHVKYPSILIPSIGGPVTGAVVRLVIWLVPLAMIAAQLPTGRVAEAATPCLPATVKAPQFVTRPCPILICGDNAPTAGDGLLFDELDLFGSPNYAGVHLAGPIDGAGHVLSATFGNASHPAWIDIELDELVVHDAVTGLAHRGSDLIGTRIEFQHDPTPAVPALASFELRIACYNGDTVKFLGGAPEPIPVYDFQARLSSRQENAWFEVCNGDPLIPDPTWSSVPYHALLYRGDRYDPVGKKVVPNNPANGWSFIACNGSAGSKMHMYRHTYAGEFDASGIDTYPHSIPQRTTLLKAITADYCGTGSPTFTVAGHPLAFAPADAAGIFPFPHTASEITSTEALWGPNGALCIDQPRYVAAPVTACGKTFPPCSYPLGMPPPSWPTMAWVITANP